MVLFEGEGKVTTECAILISVTMIQNSAGYEEVAGFGKRKCASACKPGSFVCNFMIINITSWLNYL